MTRTDFGKALKGMTISEIQMIIDDLGTALIEVHTEMAYNGKRDYEKVNSDLALFHNVGRFYEKLKERYDNNTLTYGDLNIEIYNKMQALQKKRDETIEWMNKPEVVTYEIWSDHFMKDGTPWRFGTYCMWLDDAKERLERVKELYTDTAYIKEVIRKC